MDNKLLYKNKYDTLNIEEKQTLLNNIALHYGFNIKEFASFKSDETQFYTAVFTDDSNREFVFIPGAKSVSLGWKKTISGKKEDTALIEYIKEAMFDFLLLSLDESNPVTKWGRYASLEEIKNNATEKEYDLIDKTLTRLTLSLIDDNTSYIRKVDIKPMLVERRSESVDWEFVRNIKSSDVADSPTYFKIYQEIAKSGKNFVIKKSTVKSNNKKVQKFVIDDKGLLVYKYKEVNNEELLFDYISEGYNIPNINQWEYIASSGISTLFINDDVLYSQIAQNKPNGFGVFICNNVYEPEIVSDDKYIYKGGDGGFYKTFNGPKMTNFSLSPYHNTKTSNYNYTDGTGIYARRILEIDFKKIYKPKINKKNINKFVKENIKNENYDSIIYAVNNIKYSGLTLDNAIKVIEIYHQKGFINKSLEIIKKYENDGKNNPEFLYLAGYTYFRLQHTYTAQLTLNNAVAIKRNMPECYQLLSYIYHKTSLYDNMKSSFHKLYILAPDIAESMMPILFPRGLSYDDMDYGDLWTVFIQNLAKDTENKQVFNAADTSMISEIILLDSTIKLIINKGIESYVKIIRPTGSKYLFHILEKIETSEYLKNNNNFLEEKYIDMVWEEFTACKNIIYEAESIDIKRVDNDYLQNLTNSFFDNSLALVTLAYTHYSNCRIFEAQKLFDTEYTLCNLLYQTKQLPVIIADEIRVLLENFIDNITINLYTYGDIQKLIDNIIEKTADIRKQYSDKYPVYMHLLEKNLYQDLTYILKWFNIDMDIKDTIHKLK